MSEEKVIDSGLDNEILTFRFSVKATNGLLQILGNAPFVASAGYIQDIQTQAGPQVEALVASQDEPQTAA
jgi:hypothetical protein